MITEIVEIRDGRKRKGKPTGKRKGKMSNRDRYEKIGKRGRREERRRPMETEIKGKGMKKSKG